MKNIKINNELKTRIVSGGLSLALVAGGFGLGKLVSKNNSLSEPSTTSIVSEEEKNKNEEIVNEHLDDYIAKRDSLEQEINDLLKQKKQLQNVQTFDMADLIVMENTNVNNESDLYILCTTHIGGIYDEYHDDFTAWYRMHPDSDKHSEICANYIHFDECQPLFNYLTDEEIKTLTINGGKVTTLELDQILVRIRSEYKKRSSKNNSSLMLTNN